MDFDAIKNKKDNDVTRAIVRTPLAYLLATMGIHCRSFNESPEGTLEWALKQDWRPYEHAAIQAPARGFACTRQGFQLVMPTGDLQPEDVITFDAMDDKSIKTGVVMGNVRGYTGPVVEHVVALVGPSEGGEVLWTLHAGDPIRPSTLPVKEWASRSITAAEAVQMGVEYVRCGA